MSYDPHNQPAGFVPPRKDNTLKIVLIALGCFGFMVLGCVGGIAFIGYQGFQAVEKSLAMINENPAYLDARDKIKNSKALGEVIGEPITLEKYRDFSSDQESVKPGRIRIEYKVPVSGPNAQGIATIVVEGKPFTEQWKVESTTFVLDGGVKVEFEDQDSEVSIDQD